jgi:hypothetical protein
MAHRAMLKPSSSGLHIVQRIDEALAALNGGVGRESVERPHDLVMCGED